MDSKHVPKPEREGGMQVLVWPLGSVIDHVIILHPAVTILIKNKE